MIVENDLIRHHIELLLSLIRPGIETFFLFSQGSQFVLLGIEFTRIALDQCTLFRGAFQCFHVFPQAGLIFLNRVHLEFATCGIGLVLGNLLFFLQQSLDRISKRRRDAVVGDQKSQVFDLFIF